MSGNRVFGVEKFVSSVCQLVKLKIITRIQKANYGELDPRIVKQTAKAATTTTTLPCLAWETANFLILFFRSVFERAVFENTRFPGYIYSANLGSFCLPKPLLSLHQAKGIQIALAFEQKIWLVSARFWERIHYNSFDLFFPVHSCQAWSASSAVPPPTIIPISLMAWWRRSWTTPNRDALSRRNCSPSAHCARRMCARGHGNGFASWTIVSNNDHNNRTESIPESSTNTPTHALDKIPQKCPRASFDQRTIPIVKALWIIFFFFCKLHGFPCVLQQRWWIQAKVVLCFHAKLSELFFINSAWFG